MSRPRTPRAGVVAGALLLAALGLAVFWQTSGFPFVTLDDEQYVVDNPQVRAGLTTSGALWALRTTAMGSWHPLTWLSLMLDVRLFGPDPGRMHAVALLLHLANGLLLFLVLRALTGSAPRSLLVAALFLAHPLHVESVAWISERKDLLSTLFWLLATGAYLRYVRLPGALRLLSVAALLALALAAKPMPVTFPLFLLLLDFWPLGRLRPGARPRAGVLLEKVPLFLLAGAGAAIAYAAQAATGGLSSWGAFPAAVRVGNALLAYGWYLAKAAWPAHLAFFYPHPEAGLSWTRAALAGAALAALTVAVLRARASRPYLAVGWLWFLVTLLPVIGIVQVGLQATADRYSYLPLNGIFLLAVWGGADLAGRRAPARAAAAVLAAAWVAALAVAAHAQAGSWRSSRDLFLRGAREAPSWLAFEGLGILAQREGRSDEALAHLRRAQALDPRNAQVHFNLGWVRETRGEWLEAVDSYREAARLDGHDAQARAALGNLLCTMGRCEEAIPWLEEALRIDPGYAEARSALEEVLRRAGRRRGGGD